MTARAVQVSGEQLSEFLGQPRGPLSRVEVAAPPAAWAPLKPALLSFVRRYRERGTEPPAFGGVPLCLFGSEWSGFKSAARAEPARGRCVECLARESCGFKDEVPAELHPISRSPLSQRWRDFGTAFRQVTANDMASSGAAILERIVATYRGPVSIEPSVLVSDTVLPSLRVVVFPQRAGEGAAARELYGEVLACAEQVLAELGASPSAALMHALGGLPPSPVPLGLDGRGGVWSLKMYIRLEDKSPAEKQAVLGALSRFAPGMTLVATPDLQMLGLVFDGRGLHTVKAYVVACPTRAGAAELPPPMAPDHPLVRLSGDRALATLDVWCRGVGRSNKWDFNLRDHYFSGAAAERLVAEIGSPESALQLRPLLLGPSYRADVVAVGLREQTLALYMELN